MIDGATNMNEFNKAPRPFPSIWVALVWIVLYFVLQVVTGGIAVAIALLGKSPKGTNPADMAGLAGDISLVALPTIWAVVASSLITLLGLWLYLRKDGRFSDIWLDRWSQIGIIKTLAMAIVLVGAGLVFNYAMETIVFPDVKMQEMLRKLFEAIPDTIPNAILLFVAVAVLAPILEELLFRGLLQKSLMNLMPIWAAILISSGIFAAVHMDLYATPGIWVLGAIFGYLYYKTGSLRTNIVLHMVNNAMALLLS